MLGLSKSANSTSIARLEQRQPVGADPAAVVEQPRAGLDQAHQLGAGTGSLVSRHRERGQVVEVGLGARGRRRRSSPHARELALELALVAAAGGEARTDRPGTPRARPARGPAETSSAAIAATIAAAAPQRLLLWPRERRGDGGRAARAGRGPPVVPHARARARGADARLVRPPRDRRPRSCPPRSPASAASTSAPSTASGRSRWSAAAPPRWSRSTSSTRGTGTGRRTRPRRWSRRSPSASAAAPGSSSRARRSARRSSGASSASTTSTRREVGELRLRLRRQPAAAPARPGRRADGGALGLRRRGGARRRDRPARRRGFTRAGRSRRSTGAGGPGGGSRTSRRSRGWPRRPGFELTRPPRRLSMPLGDGHPRRLRSPAAAALRRRARGAAQQLARRPARGGRRPRRAAG